MQRLLGLEVTRTCVRAALLNVTLRKTTVLALEFGVEPSFVTSVVVVTTALSPLTLTVLIAWLQHVA